ncbi:hypothetical protein KC614_00455 [candidate division WWE3 bacterium]|uniref:Uncharacterized protein n=1 Tax=candidate division WWE3 bacterium TaxID=2053526 RepID=A0A955RRL7_UNCKA|nr:hypothetical protein [candidate division WWE3 bacterium]
MALNYEPWVEYEQGATQYSLSTERDEFTVLDEMFDDRSETLKFETDDPDAVWEFLSEFGVTPENAINKNTAEILLERQGD